MKMKTFQGDTMQEVLTKVKEEMGDDAVILKSRKSVRKAGGRNQPCFEVTAALELARTILRRAERRAVGLQHAGLVPGEHLVPYLNRLADLVWVLARAAESAELKRATPARREPRPGPRPRTPAPGESR